MNEDTRLEWGVVLALATFAFANALCWATAIPIGDAPDEPGHFEVVAFEFVFRDVPEFGVDDYGTAGRVALDGYRTPINTYSAQPGLSYLVSVAAIDLFGGGAQEKARVARYPGALWAALLTVVVFLGVRAMFGGERGFAVFAATIVTCWPQLAFVFSYINNDGLTALVSAGLVSAWFTGRNGGWRDRDALLLGVAAGLVLLNKPNGFPLVPVAGMVLLVTIEAPLKRRLRPIGIASLAGVLTAGWWYVIAYRRYGWDLLASERAESLRQQLGVEWSSGRHYGMSLFETAFADFPRFGQTWIAGTLESAVGVFGTLTIALPDWAYGIIATLTVVSVVGFVVAISRSEGLRRRVDWVYAVTFGLIPALFALSLLRSWTFDFQAQGRYLFPAMLPFAAFLSVGLIGPFRGRWRGVVGFVLMLILFWVFVDGFVVRLLGAYRRTFAEFFESAVPLATFWVATLILAVSAGSLYWVRLMGATGDRGGISADGPPLSE